MNLQPGLSGACSLVPACVLTSVLADGGDQQPLCRFPERQFHALLYSCCLLCEC